jgi:hypothetical protein
MVTGWDGTGKAAGGMVPIGRSSGAPRVVSLEAANIWELDDFPNGMDSSSPIFSASLRQNG